MARGEPSDYSWDARPLFTSSNWELIGNSRELRGQGKELATLPHYADGPECCPLK